MCRISVLPKIDGRAWSKLNGGNEIATELDAEARTWSYSSTSRSSGTPTQFPAIDEAEVRGSQHGKSRLMGSVKITMPYAA